MELFEVGDDGAPFQPPPDSPKAYRVVEQSGCWLPASRVPCQLPAERDGFVGRRDGIQAVNRSLGAGTRLLSIVGIGGIGKTRLAARYAWEHLGDYPGGAWFCDLSQARSLESIAFAVAQGLQVPLGQANFNLQLGQAIAGRGECLLILDNFEQVAEHAEATLGQWMERAPLARFIVTSREVLGIPGESILPMAPLSGADAAELFLQRAAATAFGYVPADTDLAAIPELVRVLDGLPLAIELAAARVRVIPPRVLLARVRDRFDLIGARTGRKDRQSTLRATFDWSWELLGDHERAALAMLSAFEGGFTIASAAAVLRSDDGAWRDVVDILQSLVDKSFVRRVSDARFDLLQTVREYAGRQLVSTGSFASSGPGCAGTVRARHWQYFAAMDERSAVADRCIEANNLVAACRAAAEFGDSPSAVACLAVAWSALRLTGPYRVAVELAESIIKLRSLEDRERALVHWVAGDALELMGDIASARQHLHSGLAFAAQDQDAATMARLLITVGSRQTLDGDLDQARLSLEEAGHLAAGISDTSLQMLALNALGVLCDRQSQWPQAQRSYEAALRLARSLGDRHMEGGLLGNLGGLHFDMGNLQAAQTHYEMSLDVANEQGDRRWEGNARCNLGLLHQKQGNHAAARSHFETGLETARQVGHIRLEYTVLCNLGILLTDENRLDDAGQHFEQAVNSAVACSDRRAEGQFRGYLAVNQARRGRLDEARTSLDLGEKLLLAMSDQLSYALLLCDRAEVEWLGQQAAMARQVVNDAQHIAATLACSSDSDLCRRLAVLGAMIAKAS